MEIRGVTEKDSGNEHVLGFGSVSRELRDSISLNRESAGDHEVLRISMQILPVSAIFMWYILTAATSSASACTVPA